MKKYQFIFSVFILLIANNSFSQFAAGFTNTGNVLTFKLKPNANKTTGFSVIEFFLRYPTASASFTYGSVTANTTNFPGMTATGVTSSGSWEIERNNPAYAFPGYNVDHIFYTAPAPNTATTTYTMNQVYDLISVPVIGAPANVNFELVHQDSEASFYLALTSEGGKDLRPVALTDYFFPITSQIAGPSGTTIYFSGLSVPLPVKFLGFNAIRKNNDAILSWQIENESSITDRYEIERSLNGTDFVKFATTKAKNNGNSSNSYDISDLNLAAVRSSNIFYYRIKQIDKDGRFVFSEIRNVRISVKGLAVNVYPNPIKSYANLLVELEQDANVTITINDAAGKQLQNIQTMLFKGSNNKKINMENLSAGSYMLKVQTPTEIKTIAVVKAN